MHGFSVGQEYHSEGSPTKFGNGSPSSDSAICLHLLPEWLLDHPLDPGQLNVCTVGPQETRLPEVICRLHLECFPPRHSRLLHLYRYYQITEAARRIAKALGTTPGFSLNLQRMYDLDTARATTELGPLPAPVASR